MSGFNTLVKKKETISFPKEPFYSGSGSAAEKEKGIGNKESDLIALLNNGSKGIDTIAKVSVAANDINTSEHRRVSISKHGGQPQAAVREADQKRKDRWKAGCRQQIYRQYSCCATRANRETVKKQTVSDVQSEQLEQLQRQDCKLRAGRYQGEENQHTPVSTDVSNSCRNG